MTPRLSGPNMVSMDFDQLRRLYRDRGLPEDEAERAVAACGEYEAFLAPCGRSIADARVADIRDYLDLLIARGANSRERLLALARAHYMTGNSEVYIHFTRVLERDRIIANLRDHMESVLGPQRTGRVFAGSVPPVTGAPPESALPFTRSLIEALRTETAGGETAEALRANAHGIPADAFADERLHFLAASSLEEYLAGLHSRSVATLAEHARTGKVWYEQQITDAVVEFVRQNREVLGGLPEGDVIYWTKIPYAPAAWLEETDPDRRRYLACHCPMAREALAHPGGRFPRVWCTCTAGYIAQRFNAVFGETTSVDVLESVLDGDDRCRFAVHVPEGVKRRFEQVRTNVEAGDPGLPG